VIETGIVVGVSDTAFLTLIPSVRFTPEIRKRIKGKTHHASRSAHAASAFPKRCTTVSRGSFAEAAALGGVVLFTKHLDSFEAFA
jgi:hypothetical protein